MHGWDALLQLCQMKPWDSFLVVFAIRLRHEQESTRRTVRQLAFSAMPISLIVWVRLGIRLRLGGPRPGSCQCGGRHGRPMVVVVTSAASGHRALGAPNPAFAARAGACQ